MIRSAFFLLLTIVALVGMMLVEISVFIPVIVPWVESLMASDNSLVGLMGCMIMVIVFCLPPWVICAIGKKL